MSKEKPKEVEKIIAKVMKKKDLTREQALDYMLGVATGRLSALWRYDDTLPEGKATKGILQVAGRKKRAPKTARISVLPHADEISDEKPKRIKPKAERKAAKKRAKPKKRAKAVEEAQEEIAAE